MDINNYKNMSNEELINIIQVDKEQMNLKEKNLLNWRIGVIIIFLVDLCGAFIYGINNFSSILLMFSLLMFWNERLTTHMRG